MYSHSRTPANLCLPVPQPPTFCARVPLCPAPTALCILISLTLPPVPGGLCTPVLILLHLYVYLTPINLRIAPYLFSNLLLLWLCIHAYLFIGHYTYLPVRLGFLLPGDPNITRTSSYLYISAFTYNSAHA